MSARYLGLNPDTGRALTDEAHIARSIRDILTTPIGTRVMRRDYGSRIPDLIDQPMNGATLLRAASAAYMALLRWEPRIRISTLRFAPDAARPGRLVVELAASRADLPAAAGLALTIPLGSAA